MDYLIYFVIILTVSSTFFECKKSNASQSCGCDSPITGTYNSVTGKLEYDSYLKQYSILAGGTSIDGRENIICDTSISGLQTFLDSARIFSPTVIISGQLRNFCPSDTLIYIGERTNISITHISY